MLLRELVTATSGSFGNGGEAATTNPQATPLLHHMAAAHAYIQMFVTVNRTGQNDIRNILVSFLFPVRDKVSEKLQVLLTSSTIFADVDGE